ncbi:MAG: hypothetical protein AVDCRST_MAG01-01-558 [uncultured Rubrobacteraceae bacterium]|uniref:Uncharacterized protein n=1 Tax=uncultured Rubrobacteraceae bacterium TaxID=349277 RepID=A0A6J4NQK3_9ACTN|nr:MAG: hypothetical protein AVDCRST_MAG01-01-558 [uncultured Rubrobacteraceae bacterium]
MDGAFRELRAEGVLGSWPRRIYLLILTRRIRATHSGPAIVADDP